jgi:undecaprenyl-diphosphatase
MSKQQKKVIKRQRMPGIPWLTAVVMISFLLAAIISLTYQSLPWQLVDSLAHNLVLSWRGDVSTKIMVAVSDFGYFGGIMIWLLMIGMLVASRAYVLAYVAVGLSAGGFGLGWGLKLLVARLRPMGMALVPETSHSFPSLHALSAMVLYLFIAYIFFYYTRSFWRSYIVFVVCVLTAGLIGLSRVYLGVHYLSDVTAGFVLGIGWFALVVLIQKCFHVFAKKTDTSV